MGRATLLAATLAALAVWTAPTALAQTQSPITEGRLDAIGSGSQPLGSCPLKHTSVRVDISGLIARVTVQQQFQNPFSEKIEAIYVFPLSQDAAVDRMTMQIGDRIVEGEIKERGEARAIYEAARAAGNVASLLDQERPNIFTQSVANIEPGAQIDITISYSETLDWKDGEYQFDFPMVVGPRYMPGQPTGQPTVGMAPPTTQVPDANAISPPITPEGTRAGHDVSVTVAINAGLPLRRVDSRQHEVTVDYLDDAKTQAVVRLVDRATIPNKDFVLAYETATDRIEDTLLTHTDERGKFFTLVLQPPKRVRSELIVPKEIIFVIDKSGSMSGFPIETAKEAMRLCIEGLHPNDTLNLMTFSGGLGFCFEKPVPNTDENRQKALDYLGTLSGSGGTEMMAAINACLGDQHDPERVRIVCFMTDGLVGNDMAIIDAVKHNAGVARVFSFGIGTSVNRFLLDGIANAGRGEATYILNDKQAVGAAERFYERVRTPVLTDVRLDFGDLAVEEIYPAAVPDLFSSTPVVVKGRYKQGGRGTITLRGKTGEGAFERKIEVTLPNEQKDNEVLAPLWARAKVEHLMQQDLTGVQQGSPNAAIKEEILGLGLRYRLLTQFTSFVAVEKLRITEGNTVRTVAVPVEMPEGVSYEGVFGRELSSMTVQRQALSAGVSGMGGMGGMGGGARGGRGAGGAGRSAGPAAAPTSPPPPTPAAAGAPAEFGLRGPIAPARESLVEQLETQAQPNAPEESREAALDQLRRIKLATELQGLADKLIQAGGDGNLTVGKIQIKAGRVEVQILVTALSDEVLAKLKALGFQELAQAKSANVVIGTIDVKQIDALVVLAEVRHVDPTTN